MYRYNIGMKQSFRITNKFNEFNQIKKGATVNVSTKYIEQINLENFFNMRPILVI